MYSYPICSGFAVFVGCFVIILPLRRVWKSGGESRVQETGGIVLEDVENDEDIQDPLLQSSTLAHEINENQEDLNTTN
jgi:hypothetical protein